MTTLRTYRVFVHEWDVHSTVLEAESEQAAIAAADALFDAEGPEAFRHWNNGRDDTNAQEIGEGGR